MSKNKDLSMNEPVVTGWVRTDLLGDSDIGLQHQQVARKLLGSLRSMYGVNDRIAAGEGGGFYSMQARLVDGTLVQVRSNDGQDAIQITAATKLSQRRQIPAHVPFKIPVQSPSAAAAVASLDEELTPETALFTHFDPDEPIEALPIIGAPILVNPIEEYASGEPIGGAAESAHLSGEPVMQDPLMGATTGALVETNELLSDGFEAFTYRTTAYCIVPTNKVVTNERSGHSSAVMTKNGKTYVLTENDSGHNGVILDEDFREVGSIHAFINAGSSPNLGIISDTATGAVLLLDYDSGGSQIFLWDSVNGGASTKNYSYAGSDEFYQARFSESTAFGASYHGGTPVNISHNFGDADRSLLGVIDFANDSLLLSLDSFTMEYPPGWVQGRSHRVASVHNDMCITWDMLSGDIQVFDLTGAGGFSAEIPGGVGGNFLGTCSVGVQKDKQTLWCVVSRPTGGAFSSSVYVLREGQWEPVECALGNCPYRVFTDPFTDVVVIGRGSDKNNEAYGGHCWAFNVKDCFDKDVKPFAISANPKKSVEDGGAGITDSGFTCVTQVCNGEVLTVQTAFGAGSWGTGIVKKYTVGAMKQILMEEFYEADEANVERRIEKEEYLMYFRTGRRVERAAVSKTLLSQTISENPV